MKCIRPIAIHYSWPEETKKPRKAEQSWSMSYFVSGFCAESFSIDQSQTGAYSYLYSEVIENKILKEGKCNLLNQLQLITDDWRDNETKKNRTELKYVSGFYTEFFITELNYYTLKDIFWEKNILNTILLYLHIQCYRSDLLGSISFACPLIRRVIDDHFPLKWEWLPGVFGCKPWLSDKVRP